jgi:hypothetical protein
VILEEQADGERTVIEKFEKQALDVGFAVALLTADDMGSVAGSETPKLANRARQNVLLELGYFMGTLGRSRVVALCTSAVERPSDIHGLLYIGRAAEGVPPGIRLWDAELRRCHAPCRRSTTTSAGMRVTRLTPCRPRPGTRQAAWGSYAAAS